MLNLFLILYKVEEKYIHVEADRGDVYFPSDLYRITSSPGATLRGSPGMMRFYFCKVADYCGFAGCTGFTLERTNM